MRLPSKKRLVEILQHGDVDPEWECVDEGLIHQWVSSPKPTKIAAIIIFYFRNKEDGRGVMLTQDAADIPSSWFRVAKWGEWPEGS